MKGKKRGRQRKRWEDNIKEWTGMDFASSTRAAENRTRWKGIVANSSVVPRQPSIVGWNRIQCRRDTSNATFLIVTPQGETIFSSKDFMAIFMSCVPSEDS